jgi:hypothetical protein
VQAKSFRRFESKQWAGIVARRRRETQGQFPVDVLQLDGNMAAQIPAGDLLP